MEEKREFGIHYQFHSIETNETGKIIKPEPLTAAKKNAERLQVANANFIGRKMCWRLPFTSELLIFLLR